MKIKMAAILITFFVIFSSVGAFELETKSIITNMETIEVHPEESIQDAIDTATDGDTIYVYKGTYIENIEVTKSLTLEGENKELTIIQGKVRILKENVNFKKFTIKKDSLEVENAKNSVIEYNIICDIDKEGDPAVLISCSNITFRNNKITNLSGKTRFAIKLIKEGGCTIENNIITEIQTTNDIFGIGDYCYSGGIGNQIIGNRFEKLTSLNDVHVIVPGEFSTVKNNIITDIQGKGIHAITLLDDNVDVIENEITDLKGTLYNNGFFVMNAGLNILRNTIDIDSPSGEVDGINIASASDIYIEGNIIKISKGTAIFSGTEGNVVIKDNTLINKGNSNTIGIDLDWYPTEYKIQGNVIDSHYIGILLQDGHHNEITGNTIKNSQECGIKISETMDYTLLTGDLLTGATYNTIIHNNFVSNNEDTTYSFFYWLRLGESYKQDQYPKSFDPEKIDTNNWDQNYWGGPVDSPKEVIGKLKVYRYLTSQYIGDNELIAYDNDPLNEEYGQNKAPLKPTTPKGPISGNVNEEYEYSTVTTDLEGDNIYYYFSWGDGGNSGWLGPYDSGETIYVKHKFSKKGSLEIKVKAKDTDGMQSQWSDPLSVSMPKAKPQIKTNFNVFLEKIPKLLSLFRPTT